MPNLNCSVAQCGHNSHGLCGLQYIDVAKGSLSHACCAGFTPIKDLSFLGSNAACGNDAREETGVKCGVNHCYYNFGGCCSATRVKIAACCLPQNCGQTKCATYKKQG